MTQEHEFSLILSGNPIEHLDELYEAGLDDATISTDSGIGVAEVAREAPTLAEAIASAIRQLESVGDLRVVRVEPDELVTQREIADRLGRSYESVRLLAAGKRGGGTFPAPVALGAAVWRWTDVLAWSSPNDPTLHALRLIGALNAALVLRAARDRLEPAEVDAIAGVS